MPDFTPQPPFDPRRYPVLLDLLGKEELERLVCPLPEDRRRYEAWQEEVRILCDWVTFLVSRSRTE
jgi:hypothetical protein